MHLYLSNIAACVADYETCCAQDKLAAAIEGKEAQLAALLADKEQLQAQLDELKVGYGALLH